MYVGGTGSGNYTKIQDAIDNASDGDTVFVYDDSSPYKENIFINKSIQLIGEQQETTEINGRQDNIIWVEHSNVTIKRFKLFLGGNYWAVAAQLLHAPNKKISNIHISECTMIDAPILFNNVSNCTVKNCHLKDNYAISVLITWESENILIQNCIINNMGYEDKDGWTHPGDIRIEGDQYECSNISVINCHISNIKGWGVHDIRGRNITIFNNTITKTSWEGIRLWRTKNANLRNNYITECIMNGIFLKYASNVSIDGNTVTQNGNDIGYDGGFYIEKCSGDIILSHNYIRHNICMGGYIDKTPGVILYENTFLFNEESINLYGCPESSILRNNFLFCDVPNEYRSPTHLYVLANESEQYHWEGNFWNRPRVFPKPVWGEILQNGEWKDVVEFDLRPAFFPILWKKDNPVPMSIYSSIKKMSQPTNLDTLDSPISTWYQSPSRTIGEKITNDMMIRSYPND